MLGHCTVENTTAGLATLEKWLSGYEVEPCAVEGANNPFARVLSHSLLGQDYRVVDVSPNLTSQYRSRRGCKKSDEVDAQKVARAALADPELSRYPSHAKVEDLKNLTRTREALVTQLTAHRPSLPSAELEAARFALEAGIGVLKEQIRALEAAMKTLVDELMPERLELQGVGIVHAATLLAEAGDVKRFSSQHAFAMFCGCAPVERSSGGQHRRQLNIGGNRRLNRTFHMMVQVRPRCDDQSKTYLATKQPQGKTRRAASR